MSFYCVNDNVPRTTVNQLQAACQKRQVEFVEVDSRRFAYREEQRLVRGDLLYRPAASIVAVRVEQFLFGPGVSSFYNNSQSIFLTPMTTPMLFERAGLPVPKTVYCSTRNRERIRNFVEQVGGLPVVVKALGYSQGLGVMRVDSWPVLFSLLDFALAQGKNPLLCAYVKDAIHWRVIVIGDQAVAMYRNPPDADDFRTHASGDPDDYATTVPTAMADIAVQAVALVGTEFGGVDILETADGRLWRLEANFPCFFGHPFEVAGIDVAGMMVDFLLDKAKMLGA